MPTSAKPKSPRGESGPGDRDLSPEVNLIPEVALPTETVDCENPVTLEIPDPVSVLAEPAAPVVAASADNADVRNTPILTPAERKLADRMTRDIARHLGLAGSSRSVRI